MELNLYRGQVIDTNDPDKQGKVKIKILPELEKIDNSLLPWAIPFNSEISTKTLKSRLPEKGSIIRVLVDKYWKRFYYLSNSYFYELFDFSKVEDSLKKAKDIDESSVDATYDNIEFNLHEDGGLDFHNRKDGSHGFIHKSGGYALFDKNGSAIVETPDNSAKMFNSKCTLLLDKSGEVTIESLNQPITLDNKKSKILLDKNGEITIKSVGQTIALSNTVSTLGGLLEELINDLSGLTTEGSSTTQTSPTLTAQMATLLPKVKKLLK